MDVNERIDQLTAWYGDGSDGACPTAAQWRKVLERPEDGPIKLVNFFKLRETAVYPANADGGSGKEQKSISGDQAFKAYSSISVPAMARIGGSFVFAGPYQGMFLGEEEDWDLIVIGSFADTATLLALFSDPDYRDCYPHRTAACARQRVLLCLEAA